MTRQQLAGVVVLGVLAWFVWRNRATVATVTTSTAFGLGADALAEAIGFVESGGDYRAVGPATSTGHRAYGKYQVMDFNIGPWTAAYLGRQLTVAQWLDDPGSQDATVRLKIADYMKRYPSPADVASLWFSGRPASAAGSSSDVTGTTVPEYISRVLAALNG